MNPLKFISNLFKSHTSELKEFYVSEEEIRKQNWNIKFNDLGIFSYHPLGFDIDLKNQFYSIKWTDIERLEAYKVDLSNTDEICMDITFDNKAITITEETKGWYQFIVKLNSTLPLINDKWEALVLETTFEYNLTTIYERIDRKMPLKTNFHSIIKNKPKEEVSYLFQKNGWRIHKPSMKGFTFLNTWAELDLEDDGEELLLHGLVAFHPDNIKIIREIFDNLSCSYTFEFYDGDTLIEQIKKDM